MNSQLKKVSIAILCMMPLVATKAIAQENDLEQRIARLERIIQGQGLVSLLGRVDQLQNEVKRLHGENESLQHELEAMKKRQRELYLDIDKRLQAQQQQMQQHAVSATTSETSPAPATASETVTGQQLQAHPQTQAVTTPAPTPQAALKPAAVENGEADYQTALQTLRSGQYEKAISLLAAFPTRYPQSRYVPNAYYWQGEANYVLRHFDKAIANFKTVIEHYPNSSKVADATLKLGFSQYEMGKVKEAIATLDKVISQYPATSAARLAKVRLSRIRQKQGNQ